MCEGARSAVSWRCVRLGVLAADSAVLHVNWGEKSMRRMSMRLGPVVVVGAVLAFLLYHLVAGRVEPDAGQAAERPRKLEAGAELLQAQKALQAAGARTDTEGARVGEDAIRRHPQAAGSLDSGAVKWEGVLASVTTPEARTPARIQLGDSLAQLGRTEEALAQYGAVVDADPNSAEAVARAVGRVQLWCMRQLGKQAAVSRLQAIAASYPGTCAESYARYYLGRLCESEGDMDGAMACYRGVVEGGHELVAPDALARIATLHRMSGRLTDAVAANKRLIREFVESESVPWALDELSVMFSQAEALEEARTTLIEFARLNPDHPAAGRSLGNLCRIYREQDRLAEAVDAAEDVAAVYPAHYDMSGVAEVCAAEAKELAGEGQEEAAIDWWERAISMLDEESEQRAEYLILVAVRHGARREYEPAMEAVRRALDVPPSINPARRLVAQEYLASLYWQQERLEEALAAMKDALAIAIEEDQPQREAAIREAIARLKKKLGEEEN